LEGICRKTAREVAEIELSGTQLRKFPRREISWTKNHANAFGAVQVDAGRCELVAKILRKLQKTFMQVTAYIEGL
jgi:hypothetical protein